MPESLNTFLALHAARPFVWGEWDCLRLGAAWSLHIRGGDFADSLRGRYHDITTALATAEDIGGYPRWLDRTLPAHGWARTDRAALGCLCLCDIPRSPLAALGISGGDTVHALTERDGLTRISSRHVTYAWSFTP